MKIFLGLAGETASLGQPISWPNKAVHENQPTQSPEGSKLSLSELLEWTTFVQPKSLQGKAASRPRSSPCALKSSEESKKAAREAPNRSSHSVPPSFLQPSIVDTCFPPPWPALWPPVRSCRFWWLFPLRNCIGSSHLIYGTQQKAKTNRDKDLCFKTRVQTPEAGLLYPNLCRSLAES